MKPAPLRLEGSFFERLKLETHLDHVPGPLTGNLRTQIDLKPLESEDEVSSRWQVSLEVEVLSKEDESLPPYHISLVCHGYFSVPEGAIPSNEIDQTVGVTGASILYSSAREFLLVLTGRGLWGPFQLPTVSFADYQPQAGANTSVKEPVPETLASLPGD